MGLFKSNIVGRRTKGTKTLFPLDAELNLPQDKYSSELCRLVAQQVADSSFDEGVESIRRTTGGKVPKRQTIQQTVKMSQDFDAFYKLPGEPEKTSDLLVITVDGKGIVMRQEDLRPATRKAAEQQKGSHGARLAPGEKLNRKRMATVAAVYSLQAQKRTPEQIMGPKENKLAPVRARSKRVWASIEHDSRGVIRAVFEEALKRDPMQSRHWVVVVDGGEQQLLDILDIAETYQVKITLVLDLIHVLEYLWKAAHCFHPVGSNQAEEWVKEKALQVLHGAAQSVAVDLRRSATRRQLSQNKRRPVNKCADYLDKYSPMLEYDSFLSDGLPIASGVIEGACRHLIKDRLDRTGARWRMKSAEAIIRIRSLRSSGDFDAYWKFHREQELQRNYARRYATAC
ncbi:ISKra4 family transposase [Desulfoferrobacter suflitae]|uniref:ISKra4 family transposase n=1 Tax=Desulfoferrobacter suflitae TaxID=2865782 RepID=UPI002164B832|nr:ISKra4 family transposase [Desulfoferrobacter suflitae]MCK8603701.1 ISKra4 family transposase [Desulfoferrobacter suflitae]